MLQEFGREESLRDHLAALRNSIEQQRAEVAALPMVKYLEVLRAAEHEAEVELNAVTRERLRAAA